MGRDTKKPAVHEAEQVEALNDMRRILESYLEQVQRETSNAKRNKGNLIPEDDIINDVRREAGR